MAMETVHIVIDFLLNLLRDPACATLLAIGSFLTTIRPAKPARPQRKSDGKDDLSPCCAQLHTTGPNPCRKNVLNTAQKEGK